MSVRYTILQLSTIGPMFLCGYLYGKYIDEALRGRHENALHYLILITELQKIGMVSILKVSTVKVIKKLSQKPSNITRYF